MGIHLDKKYEGENVDEEKVEGEEEDEDKHDKNSDEDHNCNDKDHIEKKALTDNHHEVSEDFENETHITTSWRPKWEKFYEN